MDLSAGYAVENCCISVGLNRTDICLETFFGETYKISLRGIFTPAWFTTNQISTKTILEYTNTTIYYNMTKIASIEKVVNIEPHPNADLLEIVKVLGFQCITSKGLYSIGELVIFIQPDSILPETEWAEGYRKYSPTRIKACKLRGQWSEGIIVPISVYEDATVPMPSGWLHVVGTDASGRLGIKHYEPPVPQDLQAKGSLPLQMPKTDEERWENLAGKLPIGELVDLTLKIDGQSFTAYYDLETDTFGVTGRTLEYKLDADNNYTRHIDRYDLENKLKSYCVKHNISLAIRGESYGKGIQSNPNNPHSAKDAGLSFYSVYMIKSREYARKGHEHYFINVCSELDLPTVPILGLDVPLSQEIIDAYSGEIKNIEGKPFEGLVVQYGPFIVPGLVDTGKGEMKKIFTPHRSGSFKIISKLYDLKK